MKFREIQTNFVKISCFAKFAQCCFAATLRRSRGGGEGVGSGGGRRVPPCAPSPLKQIVPISASIYNVFPSVIYNSVIPPNSYQELGGSATFLTEWGTCYPNFLLPNSTGKLIMK